MKTAAEWSNDYFFGKKIGTIAELVREVREEALEEAAEEASEHRCATWSECCDCSGKIAAAIRQLKKQP